MTSDHIGPAPHELGAALHHELGTDLLRRMKLGNQSAAILQVVRQYLGDQGLLSPLQGQAHREALQGLYRLLLDALTEALKGPSPPSAAVLAEVRHFLALNGVTKDLAGTMSARSAFAALGSADVPFATTKTPQ